MVNNPSSVDQSVIAVVANHAEGIALGDVVRELLPRWTPAGIRGRIPLLVARGLISAETKNGRITLWPVAEEVEK